MNALLKTEGYIGGLWVRGTSAFAVTDKATGAVIANVADLGADDARAAILAADQAFKPWAATLAKDRSRLLRRWYDLMIEHADELALLLTREQGKPLAEAKGEILYGAGFVEFFAEEAKRVLGETAPTHKASARILVTAPEDDLALLLLATPLAADPLAIAAPSEVHVGMHILALGHPWLKRAG